ncbi:MAG: ABC transporter substrate-binding protein [Parasporobacterium sp.]|nr:ABC transporter substrate-binding protein [Parasporobacterium sp.]
MKKFISLIIIIISAFTGVLLMGCAQKAVPKGIESLTKTGSMELKYADQFSVDYYEGGYKLLTIADTDRFLIVPEGAEAPEGLPSDVSVLKQPINNIYLAATACMCLFDALDGLDSLRLSGTKADGWYIENARKAMEEGKILFAGKYSEPDYELMLKEGCPLAIESTMINHASDVAEKLKELGIAVLIDHSGYESHPLGRTEWIKLYGALINKEDLAEELFSTQLGYLEDTIEQEPTGKTVAFFTISSSGNVVARKSGDYLSRMIELAGGKYVFENLGDPQSKSSTETIEMETFFATAKDADIIIYNNTIGSTATTLEELMDKSDLLPEFKAVQTGQVWCTQENMFQESTQIGQMIQSFHTIFSGKADEEGLDEVPFLYRLK